MTVRELIALLAQQDQDAEVVVESQQFGNGTARAVDAGLGLHDGTGCYSDEWWVPSPPDDRAAMDFEIRMRVEGDYGEGREARAVVVISDRRVG